MAGRSFRCVRSPDAPKMVRTQGSGVRRARRPSRSGFSTTSVTAERGSHRVPAELLPEGGVDLGGIRLILARGEAGEERGGDDGGRNALVDRLEHRPAPFSRVLDV